MRSGFFNSEIIGYDANNMPVFDRAEEASFFAKYFSNFIGNGVFPNPSTNLQVLQDEGMKILVYSGVCFINGYMGWAENSEELELEESETQPRIDRVVARLDFDDRTIKLYVKKGIAAGNPVAPTLQRDFDIYEIGLADISVKGNVIQITQADITDTRMDKDLCGIVATTVEQVDTTTLFNQYVQWYENTTTEAEQEIDGYVKELKQKLNTSEKQFEEDFKTWFATIQDVLDKDTAGHLLNLITINKENIEKNANKIEKLQVKEFAILSNQWTQENEGYTATIIDATVTTNDMADVSIDNETYTIAEEAGIKAYTVELEGGIKLFAESIPTDTIAGKYVVNRGVANG